MRVLALFGSLANTLAHSSNPLSAEEFDPRKLGWMTGFPPLPNRLIRQAQIQENKFDLVLLSNPGLLASEKNNTIINIANRA
jgi:hypothetical protein